MLRRLLPAFALALGVLSACGTDDPVNPAEPVDWSEGVWRAQTIDGKPLPATVGGVRFEGPVITKLGIVQTLVSSDSGYYGPRGFEITHCNGTADMTVRGDTLEVTTGRAVFGDVCTFYLVRGARNMATSQWKGYPVVLLRSDR